MPIMEKLVTVEEDFPTGISYKLNELNYFRNSFRVANELFGRGLDLIERRGLYIPRIPYEAGIRFIGAEGGPNSQHSNIGSIKYVRELGAFFDSMMFEWSELESMIYIWRSKEFGRPLPQGMRAITKNEHGQPVYDHHLFKHRMILKTS